MSIWTPGNLRGAGTYGARGVGTAGGAGFGALIPLLPDGAVPRPYVPWHRRPRRIVLESIPCVDNRSPRHVVLVLIAKVNLPKCS